MFASGSFRAGRGLTVDSQPFDELCVMVGEWNTLRRMELLLRAQVESQMPSEAAGKTAEDMLSWHERAWQQRLEIAQFANEMCVSLRDAAPRSLHEFVVNMQPHGDDEKALGLWFDKVQADLRIMLLSSRPAAEEMKADTKTDTPASASAGEKRARRNIDWWLEKLEEYETQAIDNPSLTEAAFARSIQMKPDTVRDGLERARNVKTQRTAKLKQLRDQR